VRSPDAPYINNTILIDSRNLFNKINPPAAIPQFRAFLSRFGKGG
jgi:hypothetical protein